MIITQEKITESSQLIITSLNKKTESFSQDEATKVIYNHAIDDTRQFIADMAKNNPQYLMPFMALEEQLKILRLSL